MGVESRHGAVSCLFSDLTRCHHASSDSLMRDRSPACVIDFLHFLLRCSCTCLHASQHSGSLLAGAFNLRGQNYTMETSLQGCDCEGRECEVKPSSLHCLCTCYLALMQTRGLQTIGALVYELILSALRCLAQVILHLMQCRGSFKYMGQEYELKPLAASSLRNSSCF